MKGTRCFIEKTTIGCVMIVLALTACRPGKVTTSPAIKTPWPTSTTSNIATPGPQPDVLMGLPTATLTPSLYFAISPTPSLPTPSPTLTPSFTPLPSVTPTSTSTLTPVPAAQPPTEVSHTYRFIPIGTAQPDLSQPCPGCPRAPGYITGQVLDAARKPLAGIRLVCYNDWHRYPVVGSKGSGEYDFPILQAEATWYVVVLDEADQPLSPPAPVEFKPLEACWYRLDWQRVD